MDITLRNIFFILLFVSHLRINAQPTALPCPLDTSNFFNIRLTVHSDATDFQLFYYDFEGLNGAICESFIVSVIDSIDSYGIWENYSKFQNQESPTVVPFEQLRVKALEIRFDINDPDFNKTINLNELPLIKNKSFPYLTDICINYTNRNTKFNVNLSEWEVYKSLAKKRKLESFELYGNYQDNDIHKDIMCFVNLKKLHLPIVLNYELLNFSHLESLGTMGNHNEYYFFSNAIVLLPNTYNSDFSFCCDYLPISNFFLDNLNLVVQFNDSSGYYYGIKFLNTIINIDIPEKLEKNGEVIIQGEDLKNYYPLYDAHDTIAIGNAYGGEMVGVWRYSPSNIPEEKNRYYYFNHSNKQEKLFPRNGKWQYQFYNDTLSIEGQFVKGKKEGVWKFYDINGQLIYLKTFEKDKPRGLFVEYYYGPYGESYKKDDGLYYQGNYEIRRFYYGDHYQDYFEAKLHADSTVSLLTYILPDFFDGKIKILPNGNLLVFQKNGQLEIKRDSEEYDKMLYDYYFIYLFPDFPREMLIIRGS